MIIYMFFDVSEHITFQKTCVHIELPSRMYAIFGVWAHPIRAFDAPQYAAPDTFVRASFTLAHRVYVCVCVRLSENLRATHPPLPHRCVCMRTLRSLWCMMVC